MERKACFHKEEPSVIVCGLFTCQALVSCGFKVISAPKLLHNVCTVAWQAPHTWHERAQHSTSETLMFIHVLCTNNRLMCSDVHISLFTKTSVWFVTCVFARVSKKKPAATSLGWLEKKRPARFTGNRFKDEVRRASELLKHTEENSSNTHSMRTGQPDMLYQSIYNQSCSVFHIL